MANLAIITARGGSKRIPGKNIRHFRGKPIIAYAIEASRESGLFDEVMVSTDSEEIAKIAAKFGAKVPFLRSAHAADDFATTADALKDVLGNYALQKKTFDKACCIYPTAPFVTAGRLQEAYQKLEAEALDTVFPVMSFGYPIFRAIKLDGGRAKMLWPEYKNSRSQDLPAAYHDAGQFYFFDVATFLKSGTLIGDNTGCVIISELEGQDIDTPQDWTIAELKHQLLFTTT